MKLTKNDAFYIDGDKAVVLDKLGEGGQGFVYLVNYKNERLALKVYKGKVSKDFEYNLENNIRKGSPSESFLWPKKKVKFNDGSLGYLMAIRPKEYVSFISYLNGNTLFKDTFTLIGWCKKLCIAFKKLHEKGFSYQDLNDGSFFLNPVNGDLLICDNDNVTANQKNLGILGKIKYMAPEIVRRDMTANGPQMPDVHSDRFSLAIILFMALCLGNPFEGECLKKYDFCDEKAEMEMYGTNPVFIYDPVNTSNRPIRGYHTSVIKRYPLLPSYIKKEFERTFSKGLKDRENERTTEIEWLMVLGRYLDELITCPSCQKQYIYGLEEDKPNEYCPYCHQETKQIVSLTIRRNQILLEPGKKIYLTHIDRFSSSYDTVIGEVIQNRKNPSFWGIRIHLDHDILIKDDHGNEKIVPLDGVIPIVNHLKICFDKENIGFIEIIRK